MVIFLLKIRIGKQVRGVLLGGLASKLMWSLRRGFSSKLAGWENIMFKENKPG